MDETTDTEFFSKDRKHKVVLRVRPDGTIEPTLFRWTREVVPDHGEVCEPYWAEVGHTKTVVDSQRRAEEIADEMLRGVP